MIIQTTDNGRNGRWPTFSEARKALPQGARGKWIFSPRADAEKAYLPDAGQTFVLVSSVDCEFTSDCLDKEAGLL